MTTGRRTLPAQTGSDRVDLDALFRDTRPIGDGSELAAEVFETHEDLEGFLAWLRAERAAGAIR